MYPSNLYYALNIQSRLLKPESQLPGGKDQRAQSRPPHHRRHGRPTNRRRRCRSRSRRRCGCPASYPLHMQKINRGGGYGRDYGGGLGGGGQGGRGGRGRNQNFEGTEQEKKDKSCQKVNKMTTFILFFLLFTMMYWKVVPESISHELFLLCCKVFKSKIGKS